MKRSTPTATIVTVSGAVLLLVTVLSLHHIYMLRVELRSCSKRVDALQWKLDVLRARPYKGISPVQLQHLSADCIPAETLNQVRLDTLQAYAV